MNSEKGDSCTNPTTHEHCLSASYPNQQSISFASLGRLNKSFGNQHSYIPYCPITNNKTANILILFVSDTKSREIQ